MSPPDTMDNTLLQVRNLRKQYTLPSQNGQARTLMAVNDVSFDIASGEVLALVGESGSGKSTIGKMVLRLTEASGGAVDFDGQSLFDLSKSAMKQLRAQLQIVFQDPFSSLNPHWRIGEVLDEVLVLHFPQLTRA